MRDHMRNDQQTLGQRHIGPLGDLPTAMVNGEDELAVRGGGIDTSPTLGGPDTTPSALPGLHKVGDVTLKRG